MLRIYKHNSPLKLELGGIINELTIGYHTYGKCNSDKSNVIWVCHALTANSDVKEWWPNSVESGRFLDPDKYFIVCANVLGSQYGTTGPLSIDPTTGEPYYQNFPSITIRDMVKCHQILAKHLSINSLHSLMGSSLGGFQAMEWAILEPSITQHLYLIATAHRALPWAIALNESQRMAIECDYTYGEKHPNAGSEGLKCARSIALLSYRGQKAYDKTQHEDSCRDKITGFRAASYQRYQGEKLASRFSAYTYMVISKVFDSHNIGRNRKGCIEALSLISCQTTVIAVTSDLLFPIEEHKFLAAHIPNAKYYEIESEFGHDGFLVENEKLNRIICVR